MRGSDARQRRGDRKRDPALSPLAERAEVRGVEIEYVTKLGAYGLTVAAAFAVALAVLLSVSTTAEAVEPGKSANVTADGHSPRRVARA